MGKNSGMRFRGGKFVGMLISSMSVCLSLSQPVCLPGWMSMLWHGMGWSDLAWHGTYDLKLCSMARNYTTSTSSSRSCSHSLLLPCSVALGSWASSTEVEGVRVKTKLVPGTASVCRALPRGFELSRHRSPSKMQS